MICFPNAKINLGLNIVSRRKDGFHNIESVFYPIKFCDIIEISANKNCEDDIVYVNSGLKVDCEISDNICIKAYHLLKSKYNLPSICMHLHKVIPFGSGLGGGSSDAANVLILLNSLFNLNLSQGLLKDFAMELGSDCGFFIENKPLFIEGRGELHNNIEVSLEGLYLVLLNPGIHISTKEAYSGIKIKKPVFSAKEIVNNQIENWKDHLINDFEESIFLKHPEIKKIKERLYDTGAVYASMTGSGSAIYAIYNNEPEFEDSEIKKNVMWRGVL